MTANPQGHTFRPRARLMLLLGDQLIRDSGIAVVELVKNAYDADATRCRVTLEEVEAEGASGARVIVEDDGHGMDLETVLGVWLEPGTEHRKKQKSSGRRTRKFRRLPLGEKGVGRFAVHKLGRRVELVTRRSRAREVVVSIDWQKFDAELPLSEVELQVEERAPLVFRGRRSGTRIEIGDLRDTPWTRTQIQVIQRAIASICSPFDAPDSFTPELVVAPESAALDGVLRPEQIHDEALFRFRGRLEGDRLRYDYEFRPVGELDGVARRKTRRTLKMTTALTDPSGGKVIYQPLDLGSHRIGPIDVEFRIFHRDPVVLRLTSADPPGLREYLDRNGGVRAYRDGVRIYDFGEPGNDWLGLDSRHVRVPARRFSNQQILGAVHLDLEASADLIEKTNREGFVETEASEDFRQAIIFALTQAETEREIDKKRIQRFYSRRKGDEPVVEEIAELRAALEKAGLAGTLAPNLTRIETGYRKALDQLLTAAGTGLSLGAALHEVERGLRELEGAIGRSEPRESLSQTTSELRRTVDGLTWLTRAAGRARISASELVRQAIANSAFRFREHRIEIVDGFSEGDPDFRVHCSRRLVIATLMNLIDNSIYWLENRGARRKAIYLGTTYEVNGLPALVVADDGPGLTDEPGQLVQPFFTRKPGGTGLGLHIASEVMRAHGGQLLFPDRDEITLPKRFRGALIGLEFSA